MSQLKQLKSTVNQLAASSKKTAGSLAGYERELSKHQAAVQQAIAGSSQRKDAEIMSALQQASTAVKQATSQLQNVARIAQSYGRSL